MMVRGIERRAIFRDDRGRRAFLTRGKDKRLVEARGAPCYLAVRELDVKTFIVGHASGLGQSGMSRAVARGEARVRQEPALGGLVVGGLVDGPISQ
jgi:hypothetical protein